MDRIVYIRHSDNKKGDIMIIIITIKSLSANQSDNDRIYKQLGGKKEK